MMRRCLQLAKNGLGSTYPNPFVGCVIVCEDKIIGEGWHKKSGENHAEIVAIESVEDKSLLKKSTLFVNLEPCSHFGKTPPCAHKIVENKIPKVVIGTRDFAVHVNGKGIEYLKQNGVEVVENVLAQDSKYLNRRFFTFHQKNRPYIILKFAQTANGFFAPQNGEQKWITSAYSKQLVHKWRTEEQAILVGRKTAEIDRPQLNARLWHGNQPIRIAISEKMDFDYQSFFLGKSKTYIYNGIKSFSEENLELIQLDFGSDVLNQVLKDLYQKNIQSLIVEGGANTLNRFIKDNLWDEARVLTGDIAWENGIISPKINNAKLIKTKKIKTDLFHLYQNISS